MNVQKKQEPKNYDLEHMPKFIRDAPWYMETKAADEEAELFHQRMAKDEVTNINAWYKKGQAGTTATKYRKGACTNCGAMTHQAKECLERPRKVGAKYTNSRIARDEFDTSKQNLKLNYEGKRDRWNGYDRNHDKSRIEQWNEMNELRK